jgi:hypothetical protein
MHNATPANPRENCQRRMEANAIGVIECGNAWAAAGSPLQCNRQAQLISLQSRSEPTGAESGDSYDNLQIQRRALLQADLA